jgi:shikimate 5-dehydrogenase
VSFRSEDVFVGDGGTGGAVAAALHTAVTPEVAVKKGKKKRGKKGKAAQR